MAHHQVVVVVPLPAREGEPEALVVARDVTPAREREAALQTARDHFRRLFDEAAHGILPLDATGTVRQVRSRTI